MDDDVVYVILDENTFGYINVDHISYSKYYIDVFILSEKIDIIGYRGLYPDSVMVNINHLDRIRSVRYADWIDYKLAMSPDFDEIYNGGELARVFIELKQQGVI